MAIEIVEEEDLTTQIKVIGVGGGGGNAVNRMVESEVKGAEFIAVNTDKQILMHSKATHKIQIGEKLTRGQGAGGKPEVGEKAAVESEDQLTNALKGTDMVFITAGMGGGTGTGAAPVIAKLGKDMNILTVGVVTRPFGFEGGRKMMKAKEGIEKLSQNVDSLIVIPNDQLTKLPGNENIGLADAFRLADEVLLQAVKNISDLIKIPGYINLDFADVTSIMKDAGYAHMGFASAKGQDKVMQAAKNAISSPLLETSISGAQGIILSFKGPTKSLSLKEINDAAEFITSQAAPNAEVIFGLADDESEEDTVSLTLIATNFLDEETIAANKAEEEAKKAKELAAALAKEAELKAEEAAVEAQVETEENSDNNGSFDEIDDLASKYTEDDEKNNAENKATDENGFSSILDAFSKNRYNR